MTLAPQQRRPEMDQAPGVPERQRHLLREADHFARRVVELAQHLAEHPSLAATLDACGIDRRRWPSFAKAFATLNQSEIVRERQLAG